MAEVPVLLDMHGKPYQRKDFAKATVPKLGRKFGNWGPDEDPRGWLFPTQSTLAQFDLEGLTLDDYTVMRSHPQINSSLSILSFMQHQSPWEIECDNAKIKEACTEQIQKIWTTLNRTLAQANWAGYSPGVIEWENDLDNKSVIINKIMDLHPQECTVNWKQIEGWAPEGHVKPKFNIYDGIKQIGAPWPIPKESTLWYPILMENGNYYGRKLLKAAFTPWYFSILIHLYANRYYERYGEPTPIGRVPFDAQEVLEIPNAAGTGTDQVSGMAYMAKKMNDLRNRGVVVLPSEGEQDGTGKFRYSYDLQFMESQMRGADFERYLNRLDEEMTLALFTPVLLMRTADVGSYNLGQGHMQVYLWMMNAMNADRKQYIDKYLLRPFVDINFGKNKPAATIKFRQLGQQDSVILQSVVQGLINSNSAKPDLKELGAIVGLTLNEVNETLKEPGTEKPTKKTSENAHEVATKTHSVQEGNTVAVSEVGDPKFWAINNILTRMIDRARPQIEGVFRTGQWSTKIDFGYVKQLIGAYRMTDVSNPQAAAQSFYAALQEWCSGSFEDQLFNSAEEMIEALEHYTASVVGSKG